jgi:hypothetical protein
VLAPGRLYAAEDAHRARSLGPCALGPAERLGLGIRRRSAAPKVPGYARTTTGSRSTALLA